MAKYHVPLNYCKQNIQKYIEGIKKEPWHKINSHLDSAIKRTMLAKSPKNSSLSINVLIQKNLQQYQTNKRDMKTQVMNFNRRNAFFKPLHCNPSSFVQSNQKKDISSVQFLNKNVRLNDRQEQLIRRIEKLSKTKSCFYMKFHTMKVNIDKQFKKYNLNQYDQEVGNQIKGLKKQVDDNLYKMIQEKKKFKLKPIKKKNKRKDYSQKDWQIVQKYLPKHKKSKRLGPIFY